MSDRSRARGERLYQLVLRLFPRAFRDRFGLQLLELFRDKHRAARQLGRGALARFWVRITADAFISALSERLTPRPALHLEEGLMEGWLQEIRYAARMMVRRPVVSIAIIGTLALGIGANTAIFSLSYSVARRTREIGVRVALGATRGDVSRLVIREGLAMAAIGVAIGLATALARSRFLRSVLYGVRPSDPMTYPTHRISVCRRRSLGRARATYTRPYRESRRPGSPQTSW